MKQHRIVQPEVVWRLAEFYGEPAYAAGADNARMQDGGGRLSGNSKSLLVMFTLFSVITAAQYYAAILAHSVALKADCASMAVDALSYLGNMVAECTLDKSCRAILELIMSATSLVLLAYFTGVFFVEAAASVGLLHSSDSQGGEEDVDATIVFAFAALGILFDVLSLTSYKVWHVDRRESHGRSTTAASTSSDININMLSALLHVLSDLARSTTTFVEGLVLLFLPNLNSAKVDSWSALVVCTLIFTFGVLHGFYQWVGECWTYCTVREHGSRAELL